MRSIASFLSFARKPSVAVHLRADRRGSAVVPFALSSLVVMTLVGAAIDYNRVVGMKEKLQTAVDQAMLAAFEAPAASRVSVATNNLNAALAGTGITATWTSGPALNAAGALTGTATGTMPLIMQGMTGATQATATARATIANSKASTPSSVTFTLTGAYGWYWKQVDLYIHQPGASSNTLLASWTPPKTSGQISVGLIQSVVSQAERGHGRSVAGFL